MLGDSLSQGIGASSVDQSWVLQTWRDLDAHGIHYRVANLSISGGRVGDVLDRQLPAIAGLSATPALVTVLIGSNDIIKRDLRAQLPDRCRTMLPLLPTGTFVATVPRTRGVQAEVNHLVAAAEADGAVVAVPLHFAAGARAPDHFHPNDTGYAAIADSSTTAILARRPHIEAPMDVLTSTALVTGEPPQHVRRLSSSTARPRRGRAVDGTGRPRVRRVGCHRSARAGGGGCTNRPTPAPKSRPARHSEALTHGFQRGLFGASIALVIAAVIALRAPNVRATDMAVDADEDAGVPVPVPAAG